MADAKAHVTQEEFDRDWLTPAQALNLLSELSYDTRRTRLARRLADGLIRAIAKTAIIDRKAPITLYDLPKGTWDRWACLADHGFWESGDTNFFHIDAAGYGDRPGNVRAYGVRFDPVGVADLVPAVPKSPPAIALPAIPEGPPAAPPPAKDRKPVPQAWLDAWFAAYTVNLAPALDTEVNACRSAEAFFPGHSVARDRVRDLRKGIKTGRKPREG